MTVVSGVSGSGKSTLVRDSLQSACPRIGRNWRYTRTHRSLGGDIGTVKAIEFVDQNPIGTSSRSNPATYLKAYDEIRKLFSEQQLARQIGVHTRLFLFQYGGWQM